MIAYRRRRGPPHRHLSRRQAEKLLRTVTFPQTAFVLALDGASVRLLEVTPGLPTFEMRVPDLPK
ncbi:MAG TPA: hypothetical protein VF255_01655 [Solirubrobacterales bacterium]